MKGLDQAFVQAGDRLRRALDVVMRHMRITLAIFIATAVAAVILYATVPRRAFSRNRTRAFSAG